MTRTLFIGGTPRGRKVLELLLERNVDVVGIYAMREDDHEQFRESETIAEIASARNLPVSVTKKITDDDLTAIRELRPELIVIVGWRTIIEEGLYMLPRYGCVGVHDSPLPRYRGFAPVNWAIINGEREWGVSLMHIGAGIDSGDIVGQKLFLVAERASAPELYTQVTEATLDVISEHIVALQSGTAPRVVQDHAAATFACARTPDDGVIDWAAPTVTIDRLIRGLTFPYPGAHTTWKGKSITIWEAEPVDPTPVFEGRIPGRVVAFTESTADVLTGNGLLRVKKVQLAGEERVDAGQVLRSVKASLGS